MNDYNYNECYYEENYFYYDINCWKNQCKLIFLLWIEYNVYIIYSMFEKISWKYEKLLTLTIND